MEGKFKLRKIGEVEIVTVACKKKLNENLEKKNRKMGVVVRLNSQYCRQMFEKSVKSKSFCVACEKIHKHIKKVEEVGTVRKVDDIIVVW